MSSYFLNRLFATIKTKGGIDVRVTSLITEYNPFHNGHIYHIEESRKAARPDVVIAIMSGSFTQRGEAAITDKFIRTRHALGHVDLVAEMPLKSSISFADDFALGGVHIADLLKSTHLVFGSESGDINALKRLHAETGDNFDKGRLSRLIRQGYSHPRALEAMIGNADAGGSNNILGLGYLKAIETLGSPIIPMTIKRQSNLYNDRTLSEGAFSSATSLRRSIREGEAENAKRFMPPELVEDILQAGPVSNEHFFNSLKLLITHRTPAELREIYMMTEGLEHRLKAMIRGADNYDEYMHRIKTKRYTWTRLNRLMICILLNIRWSDIKDQNIKDINAVRILGMNSKGREYLSTLKEEGVEIITNVNKKNAYHLTDEIMATDVYNIARGSSRHDFNTPVIIVR
jgi:predicted nucleotidyltransferase